MNAVSKSAIFLAPFALWSGFASANMDKVAAYLNQGSAAPVVVVKNGALLAPAAQAKGIPGHYIEDCRKGAIRQGLLDASATANATIELSRKGSHRMKLTGRETEDDDVQALVGVRLVSGGTAKEVTFSYLMNDPHDGTCSIVAVDKPVDGMTSRKNQEKKVLTDIIPKIPAAQLEVIRQSYSKKGPATNEDIAKKSVAKLMDWECEQYSINMSVEAARQAFAAKNPGTQPIIFLDYANSKVQSILTAENKDAEMIGQKMTGSWAVRLSDATATKTMSATVAFDVTEGADSCTGTISPIVVGN